MQLYVRSTYFQQDGCLAVPSAKMVVFSACGGIRTGSSLLLLSRAGLGHLGKGCIIRGSISIQFATNSIHFRIPQINDDFLTLFVNMASFLIGLLFSFIKYFGPGKPVLNYVNTLQSLFFVCLWITLHQTLHFCPMFSSVWLV